MELKAYDIIKRAVVTAKSRHLLDSQGKFTFEVHALANKLMIKAAVESVWNVKVDKVAVLNVRGRRKRFSGRYFTTSCKRKAIVTLRQGYSIEMPWQYESATPGASGVVAGEK